MLQCIGRPRLPWPPVHYIRGSIGLRRDARVPGPGHPTSAGLKRTKVLTERLGSTFLWWSVVALSARGHHEVSRTLWSPSLYLLLRGP